MLRNICDRICYNKRKCQLKLTNPYTKLLFHVLSECKIITYWVAKMNLHQIWSKMVNKSTKCQTVPPGTGHILHVHARIAFCYFATPYLQSFRSFIFCHNSFWKKETLLFKYILCSYNLLLIFIFKFTICP